MSQTKRINEMQLKNIMQFLYRNLNLILVVGIIIFLLIRNCNPSEPEVKIVEKDNTDLIQELNFYKTLSGQQAGKLKQVEVSRAELEKRVESLAKELKIKPKYIQGEITVITQADTVLRDVPYYIDSSKGTFKFQHKDAWASIEGNNMNPEKKLTFEMHLTDTIKAVENIKKRFLRKSITEVTFITKSPYSQAISGYSYRVKPRQLLVAIGPGINYNPFNSKLSVGIQAMLPLIKIYK